MKTIERSSTAPELEYNPQSVVRLKLERSKPLPFKPNTTWLVDDKQDGAFKVDIWHICTFKGKHVVRFGVNDRQFEIYFSRSGRVVHVVPIRLLEDRTEKNLKASLRLVRREKEE